MKPITEDVVHSLMQGIAVREKSRPRRDRSQGKSAKIIKFTGKAVKDGALSVKTETGRRTISGVFCYVSRLKNV